MRDEIASLVHRVFSRGLHLTSRLQQQPRPDLRLLETERGTLLGPLSMAHQARGFPDYEGDPRPPALPNYPQAPDMPYPPNEVIMATQPWVAEWWNFQKLETTLYSPLNDRHWKFWEQAGLAEIRADIDALEAFYLCVMLGFRGKYRDNPKELRDWRARVEPRLRAALRPLNGDELPSRRLVLHKDPLVGYRLFQRMLAAALLVSGAAVLGGAFYAFNYLFTH
jgi:hypothetical protein